MALTLENIMLIGSILLFISIIFARNSSKIGLPMLVIFLGVGMLAGNEGIGGINFNDPKIAQFIGIISLCVILFSSGLDTDWYRVKPIAAKGVLLSTLGVLLTTLSIGIFAWVVVDFTIYEGLLLGAIVSSTDAAAVFSILREKKLSLKSGLRPILEFESGSNDPMAYVLVLTFLNIVISGSGNIVNIFIAVSSQLIIGAFAGFIYGFIGKNVINTIKLAYEGLYPILLLALVYISYYTTDMIGGNGFLAVYICGIYIGHKKLIHKRTILKMFDATAWLMQIILFLTLGLLVNPSDILLVMGIGLLFSAFLIFAARPIAVFLSLLPFKMRFRKKLFISWVGLRGAAPIVFATFPLLAGIDKAGMIFNIVFFISITSVLLQGTTLAVIAKWLKVSLPQSMRQTTTIDRLLDDTDKSALVEITIPENTYAVKKRIVDLNIPNTSIIAMIKRGDQFVTPKGDTIINACDVLMILAEDKIDLPMVYNALKIDDTNLSETRLNKLSQQKLKQLRLLFQKRR